MTADVVPIDSWRDKLGRLRGTVKSTDPCDTCGKILRACTCICIKHPCCGGGLYYEGHLADCPLMRGVTE